MKTPILKLSLLAVAFLATSVSAKITLPALISDHMVLQQNSTVKLWGKSTGKNVTVTPSWSNKNYTAAVDQNGNWVAKISTPKAGGPYTIKMTDGTPLKVNDVLIGEVWLCGGQSNMEMPVKGFFGQPVTNSFEKIMAANPKTPIRMVKVKKSASKTILDNTEGNWTVNSPADVANITAAGYFFAQNLYNVLNVPIGIIDNNWGGSKVEAWMSKEMLAPFAQEVKMDFPEDMAKVKAPQHVSQALYNGMIDPVKNYTIKGAIWYQGESNIENYQQYERLFPAMVKGWRDVWGIGEFPFYYVQIAPFVYAGADKTPSAKLQEVQAACLKTIPNSGMVVSLDAGNRTCIHPENKQIISDRLAALALVKTYNIEGIPCQFPMYKSHEVKGNKVVIKFDNAPMGITAYGKIEGFEVAGEDKKFYPAVVKSSRNDVSVWSDSVPNPVAVRYGYKNYPDPVPNLTGGNNFPVAPFRTDNWD